MTTGWMIGVLVTVAGEPKPARRYFAVARADRAQAEWAALDSAGATGAIATSPVDGMEPVEAIDPLSAPTVRAFGLAPGQVKAFGERRPRRRPGG
jgi:hypothetical protein